MASQINEKCTNCGICAPLCPTNSILAGQKKFVIDLDSCEGCLICQKVCPADAIEREEKK